MAQCYLPDAVFRDPVFGELRGREAGDMWRMLTARASELSVELLAHAADESSGDAHWRAHYRFPATRRPVINDVRASFRFLDGRIAEHEDQFSFLAWSRQALGTPSLALGWSPPGRRVVRRRARAELERFRSSLAR